MNSTEPPTILVIEDDPVLRLSLACFLEDSGYLIKEAPDGASGLDAFRFGAADLLLVDLQMPRMNGLKLLSMVREESPQTPVVILSGTGKETDVVDALRLGAWDYVLKPIADLGIVEHAIEQALERAALLKERERYQGQLEQEIARRTEALQRELKQREQAETRATESLQRLERVLEGAVRTFVAIVEIKDPYTSGHQRRVTQLVVAIAEHLGLEPERVETARIAGLLHDIGKVCVPAEILARPGKLSEHEIRLLQTHAEVSFQLIKAIPFDMPISKVVHQHHERLDGSGYPNGARGDEILFEARILAVADVVEALSSHRPYRPALGTEVALGEIKRDRGTLYDSQVVDACVQVFDNGFQFS